MTGISRHGTLLVARIADWGEQTPTLNWVLYSEDRGTATAGKIWRLSTTGVYGPDGTETNGRRGRESFAERN